LLASLQQVACAPGGGRSQPKKLTVSTARKYMKELKKVLSADKSQTALRKASKDVDVKAKGATTALRKAIGPVLASLVKDLTGKYGFTEGFDQGMAAVAEAMQGRDDRKLNRYMEDMHELIRGTPSPKKAGRVPGLDILADQFVTMGLEDRRVAISRLEKKQEKESADSELFASTAMYLNAMRGMVESGDSYIREQMLKNLQEQDKSELHRDVLDKQINVLGQFLRNGDTYYIQQELKKLKTDEL